MEEYSTSNADVKGSNPFRDAIYLYILMGESFPYKKGVLVRFQLEVPFTYIAQLG